MPGVLLTFVLVFRVKTNTRTTLHLSAGMRGSVPSSSTSGKGNVAHGETSVPVANGDWIVLVCLLIVCRSHETSTIRSELDTTHRALRCIHDSREAPLSAAPVVPVTSLWPDLVIRTWRWCMSHWLYGLCNKSNYSILAIKQTSQSTPCLLSSFLVTAFLAKCFVAPH